MPHQINSSINSLETILQKYDLNIKPSVFGTLIVENFFSTVRAKVRFPNLWEYSVFYSRALMELIKNNATDSTFIGPKFQESFGKCYNNQIGTFHSFSLLVSSS